MSSLIRKYGHHEWLVKSHFSFLIGSSTPKELWARAMNLQYRSLCIADYDGLYGAARMFRSLPQGMSLQVGAEVHLQADHEVPLLVQQTLCLVALSKRGYANLCRLLTISHKHALKKGQGVLPLDVLCSHSEA